MKTNNIHIRKGIQEMVKTLIFEFAGQNLKSIKKFFNGCGKARGRSGRPALKKALFPAPACKMFTLIELLIVIAILAILAGMLLPALNRARQMGLSISCTGNLKQHGLVYSMYLSDFGDMIPPYARVDAVNAYYRSWYQFFEEAGLFPRLATNDYSGIMKVKWFYCPRGPFLSNPADGSHTFRYGYNSAVGPYDTFQKRAVLLDSIRKHPAVTAKNISEIMVFADSAVVAAEGSGPRTLKSPYQQYYTCSETSGSVNLRHNRTANTAFMDGHCGRLSAMNIKQRRIDSYPGWSYFE